MRRWAIAVILVVAAITPCKSWAWGCVGHQVVAYIAAQNLNPTAAANVADLLSNSKYGNHRQCLDPKMGTIEYFATWADDVRTPANADWHFWDVPLADNTAVMPKHCDSGCVVKALQDNMKTLAGTTNLKNPKQRAAAQTALQFIIHLVGDAHQPMHIVDNGDRGGNCVPVSFKFTGLTKTTAQGKDKNGNPDGKYDPNLHSIWDDLVIKTMLVANSSHPAIGPTQTFGDSVAKEFAVEIKKESRATVDPQKDFAVWALQAHALAKPKSYEQMPAALPVDPNPQTLKGCLGVSSKFAKLNEVAGSDFVTQAQPVVRNQLALAGGRLAATLNTIWPAVK